MGMSLLWFVAAAKKKQEASRKREATSKKKKSDEDDDYEDEENRNVGGYDLSNHKYQSELQEYSMCVTDEIKDETTELAQFFQLLQEEYQVLMKEKKNQYEVEKEELILKIREMCPMFDKLHEELQKKGLQIQHSLQEEYDNYLFMIFNHLVAIDGEHIYSFFDSIKTEYNHLSKSEEEDRMSIHNLKEKLYVAKKKVKKARFNKEKLNKDVVELEKKLERQEKDYQKANYKEKIEIFKKLLKLDEKEKELILATLEELKASLPARSQVRKLTEKINHINSAEYDDERIIEVIERLMKQGKVTEEQLAKVFLALDKVAHKMVNGEYSRSQGYYTNEFPYRIVKAFIKNIYQRNKDNKKEEENTNSSEGLSKTR